MTHISIFRSMRRSAAPTRPNSNAPAESGPLFAPRVSYRRTRPVRAAVRVGSFFDELFVDFFGWVLDRTLG